MHVTVEPPAKKGPLAISKFSQDWSNGSARCMRCAFSYNFMEPWAQGLVLEQRMCPPFVDMSNGENEGDMFLILPYF